MWDHGVPANMASSWRRGLQTTRALFLFNHNAIGEGFYTKFAKPKIVSPTAMAKLVIDSDRLESFVINREICIILSQIGRSSAKSGDLEALVTK